MKFNLEKQADPAPAPVFPCMKPYLWQIYFLSFVFLGVLGLILTAGVSFFVYRITIDEMLEERIANIQFLADTIGSPFWIHQELTHIPGTMENFLVQTEKIPGVIFAWMVNDKTKKVEKSGDKRDVGKIVEPSPAFESNVHIQDLKLEGQAFKILSVKSQAGDNIMMGVSMREIQRRALLSAVFLGYEIFGLFAIAGLIVFLINRRFITNPLFLLIGAFEKLKKEDYSTRVSGGPTIELNDVFLSFNDMAEKLNQIRDRERALAQEKSEFVAISAHRLRTPLSAARWTLQLFLDEKFGKLTEEQRKFIASAYENNNRMITLVSDLLNVAEIEAGRFIGKFVLSQLEDIVQSAVDSYKEEIESKGLAFTFEKPKEKLLSILADVEKLKLAIQNLLDNAVHYTLPKGSIIIRIRQINNEAEFSIKDTGIGIPKDQQDRMFTKFFRARNAASVHTEGSGFGLYVAKNIIEAHKGKIWFESEENRGTTFFFRVPLYMPKEQ